MLGKLKKKAPRDNTASPGRGIVAGSNAIHKVATAGLGLALLVLVASFAFLLLVREPSVRAAQTQVLAAGYAEQQATNIGAYISRLRQRLQSTAHAPAALAVIDGSAADDNAVEAELKAYFPDLASLHIVPLGDMGTAEFGPGTHGLRNNIELDLVRRASEGETTLPESFRFEDRWMTSVAELVKGAGEQHKGAVLVATVDNAALASLLQALKPGTGSYALEQLYTNRDGSTHTTEIARTGSGNASDLQSYAVIPDTNWRIAFTPSASLVDSLHVSSRPLWVVFAMCLVALLGGFAIVMVRIPKIIEEDSFRILAAADRKSDLTLAIPQLVDLARQLRRATLRALRQAAEDSAPPPKMEVDTLDLMDDEPIGDLEEVLELDTEFEEEALQEVDVPSGFPAHIFRAYDIRGNATSELTPELMGRIGQAVGSIAGERGQQIMLVACDGRNSSPALKSALIRSLMDTGRDIIDIGLVPTPVMYFATRHLKARSGLMITGSHNPKTDNGLKIVLDQQTIHAGGIEGIRNRVLSGDFSQGKGRLITEDVAQSYIDHIQQDIAIAVPLKIVIDAGNGATGTIAPVLFEELGCEVVPMFCNIDGNFPNHAPDTSEETSLAALVERVKEEEADFGVAFDGDGDRLAVVTPSGRIVRSDVLLMIFAQDVVSRNPGADVVFDVKCSRNLTELITHCGGRPVLSRTGHAFMKQKMAETGALLGGEFSGHMFFGERWYGFDDGMYAAARLAEILSTQGDSLDAIIDSFPTSVNTPEIKIPVPEASKLQLMERIVRSADFANGKVNTLDGIRVDFAEGWGLLRASNTNPMLTARFEAESEQALETIKNEFRQQIALVDPSLDVNF